MEIINAPVPRLYDGFTQEQLNAAFNALHDPADWRAPIKAVVHVNLLELSVRAIRFFTATEPHARVLENGAIELTSVGYRMGPAGP
jgi:hypothetical protein